MKCWPRTGGCVVDCFADFGLRHLRHGADERARSVILAAVGAGGLLFEGVGVGEEIQIDEVAQVVAGLGFVVVDVLRARPHRLYPAPGPPNI